jgi:hypothetical protein
MIQWQAIVSILRSAPVQRLLAREARQAVPSLERDVRAVGLAFGATSAGIGTAAPPRRRPTVIAGAR